MRRLLLLFALVSALLSPAVAQADVSLFDDIPPLAVAFHGADYFVGGTGRLAGLYRSDGTPGGTTLVARSDVRYGLNFRGLVVVGDHLVFTTQENSNAPGTLYVSDGTAAGTRRAVAQQRVSTAAGRRSQRGPRNHGDRVKLEHDLSFGAPIVAGNQLYVAGSRGFQYEVLYRVNLSNGALTPVDGAGTSLHMSFDQFGVFAVTSDGGLFFSDSYHLWHVSPSGPAVPLPASGEVFAPRTSAVLGNLLYFFGIDGAHGTEPWVTDGTPAGTHLIADITPGTGSSGGFISTPQSIYITAGRDAGSALYLLTAPGAPAAVTFNGSPVTAGASQSTPDALWFGDGTDTSATDVRLRVLAGSTIAEQPPGAGFDENGTLIVPGQRFYTSGLTLRSTDSQGNATVLGTVAQPHGTKNGPEPTFDGLTPVGDEVWFDSSVVNDEPGVLWRSDGTAAGTHPVVTPGQITPVDSTLSASATPPHDHHAPYRWQLSGTVNPAGLLPSTAAQLCTGTVTITVTAYRSQRTLQRLRARASWNGKTCAFRSTVAPRHAALNAGHGKLTIGAQFDGTDHISPSAHLKRTTVKYG